MNKDGNNNAINKVFKLQGYRPSVVRCIIVEKAQIAKLRLEESYWKVYWKDSKDKWHFVDDIEPVKDFEKQLMEIDNNDIFWV